MMTRLREVMRELRVSPECAASLADLPAKTVRKWMDGTITPSTAEAAGVLFLVQSSRPTQEQMAAIHHLYFCPSHGWQMRCTIQHDKRKMGMRVKRNMRTKDAWEAIQRKQFLLDEWRKLGLTIVERLHKRRSPST